LNAALTVCVAYILLLGLAVGLALGFADRFRLAVEGLFLGFADGFLMCFAEDVALGIADGLLLS
jgi:hypothetical protein